MSDEWKGLEEILKNNKLKVSLKNWENLCQLYFLVVLYS